MGIRLTTKRQRNQAEENWKTSNSEHRTSNIESNAVFPCHSEFGVQRSMFDVLSLLPHRAVFQIVTRLPRPQSSSALTAMAPLLAYCGRNCSDAAPTAGPMQLPTPMAASWMPPCSPLASLASIE